MDVRQKVLEQITEAEVVALTQQLVRIESYFGVPNVETAVAKYISSFLKAEAIDSEIKEIFDGRSNVYGSLLGQKTGPTLLFCGHIDTVPPNNMEIEPFNAYIEDGKIYGRGAADMKGGVAAMLLAMAAIKRAGVKLKGAIKFAGVVGEESPNTSEGARALVAEGKVADMAIVGEATNLDIAAAHKGMEWLKVEVKGKAAHGSVPDKGVNAIVKAAQIFAPEFITILDLAVEVSPLSSSRVRNTSNPSSCARLAI
jgi:succinyl-diaminopimelate desuccinylase